MDSLSIANIVPTLDVDARDALAEADVVIGVDDDGHEFTVFGLPSLESSTTLKKPSAMRIVRVLLDGNNAELDALARIVRSVKGLDSGRRPR